MGREGGGTTDLLDHLVAEDVVAVEHLDGADGAGAGVAGELDLGEASLADGLGVQRGGLRGGEGGGGGCGLRKGRRRQMRLADRRRGRGSWRRGEVRSLRPGARCGGGRRWEGVRRFCSWSREGVR
jgi:hypothetical protein